MSPTVKVESALLTVMVLLALATSTALAVNPTAELTYAGTSVKPGKTINFIFRLNSGTYTKKGDVSKIVSYNVKWISSSLAVESGETLGASRPQASG